MSGDRLAPLQRSLLKAFFRHAPESFYLSGGAALAGFHLRHRTTDDLVDLFCTSPDLDAGVSALRLACETLGASLEPLSTGPHLRRFLVTSDDASVVVDLVHEVVEQGSPDKPSIEGIRVDPAEEIMATKLGALLGRSELRDLVDLRALEDTGLALRTALDLAQRKDAGLSPASLAWTLQQLVIGDDAPAVGDVPVLELRRYRDGLVERLTTWAHPGST